MVRLDQFAPDNIKHGWGLVLRVGEWVKHAPGTGVDQAGHKTTRRFMALRTCLLLECRFSRGNFGLSLKMLRSFEMTVFPGPSDNKINRRHENIFRQIFIWMWNQLLFDIKVMLSAICWCLMQQNHSKKWFIHFISSAKVVYVSTWN